MRVNVPAILLLLALAAHHSSAQGPPGEAEGDLTTTLETVEVAEGVLAFVAAVPRSQIVNGNSVAVLGRDAVLVVDAGLVPSLARRIVAEVRRRTDLPIRFLVNTHWHWDHNLGNFVFREEQPGVAIVSTPFTRDSISAFNSAPTRMAMPET